MQQQGLDMVGNREGREGGSLCVCVWGGEAPVEQLDGEGQRILDRIGAAARLRHGRSIYCRSTNVRALLMFAYFAVWQKT